MADKVTHGGAAGDDLSFERLPPQPLGEANRDPAARVAGLDAADRERDGAAAKRQYVDGAKRQYVDGAKHQCVDGGALAVEDAMAVEEPVSVVGADAATPEAEAAPRQRQSVAHATASFARLAPASRRHGGVSVTAFHAAAAAAAARRLAELRQEAEARRGRADGAARGAAAGRDARAGATPKARARARRRTTRTRQLSGKQFYFTETRSEAKAAVKRDHADASDKEQQALVEKALRAGWKALDDGAKAQWAADAPEIVTKQLSGKQFYRKEKRAEAKAAVERDHADASGREQQALVEKALRAGWKALDDGAKAQWDADAAEAEVVTEGKKFYFTETRSEAKAAVKRDHADASDKEQQALVEALRAGWKALDDGAKAQWDADAAEVVTKQLSGKQFYFTETRSEAKAAVKRDHADASDKEKKALVEKALYAGWKALDDGANAQWDVDAAKADAKAEAEARAARTADATAAVLSEEARRRTLKQAVLRELLGFEHKVEAGMLAGKPLKVIGVVYDERDDRFWCKSRSQSGEEELTPLWAMPAEAKAKADAAAEAAATSDRRRPPKADADGDRTGHSYYPSAKYERVLGTHITGQSNHARDSRLVLTSADSVISGPGSASVQLHDEACGFRVENLALDAKLATAEVIGLLNKRSYHPDAFSPTPYVDTKWSVPKKLDVAFDLAHAEFGNQGRTEVTGACRDDLLHNAAGFTSDYVPFPDSATISKRWFEDRRVCVAPMVPGESGQTDHRDARVCNEFQPPKKKIPPLTMVFVLYLRRKLADGSFEEAPDVDIKDVSGVRFRTVPRTGETRDTSEDFEIRVPHGGFWAICARANAYYTHGVFCAKDSKLPPGVYRVPVIFSNYGRASDD
ncbi:RNA polymerase II transcription regulator recruiting protein [Aureococcus anophagefferens]|nr:RNA polymerase II transcription regulator recruiting protein [Aureococcus anophagefferens]